MVGWIHCMAAFSGAMGIFLLSSEACLSARWLCLDFLVLYDTLNHPVIFPWFLCFPALGVFLFRLAMSLQSIFSLVQHTLYALR